MSDSLIWLSSVDAQSELGGVATFPSCARRSQRGDQCSDGGRGQYCHRRHFGEQELRGHAGHAFSNDLPTLADVEAIREKMNELILAMRR